VKTYYELLEVASNAPVDEIKRSFRREIAKYHPDKVQHLGKEFQEIAATRAAELTEAYKTLIDAALRAEYDALLAEGGAAAPMSTSAPATATPPPARPAEPATHKTAPAPAAGGPVFKEDQAGASELLRRATVARFRSALMGEFGTFEEVAVQGFEITCIPAAKFWSLKMPPRVLGRFVQQVNGAALSETWALAAKMKKDPQRDLCVFLMGPALAPAGELANAIAEQRKKPMPAGGKLVMIPVSTKNWSAHVPTDAPDVVKSLISRLKSA
jgi:hypothetical protein